MGYSPSKIFRLGQKLKMPTRCEKLLKEHIKVVACKKPLQKQLKMPRRCEKLFYKLIKVVVCTKPLQKTPNSRKMTAF